MNINWPRWIKASLVKWFSDRIATSGGLSLFIEGFDRRTQEKPSYAEFRLDGPYGNEVSINYWEVTVCVNILVVTTHSESDAYAHERNVGLVASAFAKSIPIYCFGNGMQDNPALLLGCMLISDAGLDIANYGQVHGEIKTQQSMVEVHYVMKLTV